MTMLINPISETFVAEIKGVDASQRVDDETFEKILDAFHTYRVLAFRNQNLTPEQHIAFSRRMGDLQTHMLKTSLHPEFDKVIVLSTVPEDGTPKGGYSSGRFWHSDLSYMERPSLGSLLYAVELPGEGLGDTLFADMCAAYDALSDKMKKRIDGLKAVHRYFSYTPYAAMKTSRALDLDRAEADRITWEESVIHGLAQIPEAIHPVVRTHPVTGRKALYVNEGLCVAIVGLPEDESRSLLIELFEHSTRSEFVYRHKWQDGDLVAWDNRFTIHSATRLDPSLRRVMHRTTVSGDRPL